MIVGNNTKNEKHSYWSMHYDASPTLHAQLTRQLRNDIRVLRWSAIKLAERLDHVVDHGINISLNSTRLTDSQSARELETISNIRLGPPVA